MAAQNIPETQENNTIFTDIAEVYQEALNAFINDSKNRYVKLLMSTAQKIQKDAKEQVNNHPHRNESEQINHLIEQHKKPILGKGFNNFIDKMVLHTVTVENIPRIYDAMKKDINKGLVIDTEEEVRSLFTKQYVTASLSDLEKQLVSSTIENAIDNVYHTPENKMKRVHYDVKNFLEKNVVDGGDLKKEDCIQILKEDYLARNPSDRDKDLMIATIENTIDEYFKPNVIENNIHPSAKMNELKRVPTLINPKSNKNRLKLSNVQKDKKVKKAKQKRP